MCNLTWSIEKDGTPLEVLVVFFPVFFFLSELLWQLNIGNMIGSDNNVVYQTVDCKRNIHFQIHLWNVCGQNTASCCRGPFIPCFIQRIPVMNGKEGSDTESVHSGTWWIFHHRLLPIYIEMNNFYVAASWLRINMWALQTCQGWNSPHLGWQWWLSTKLNLVYWKKKEKNVQILDKVCLV